jgi:hypothetical protein
VLAKPGQRRVQHVAERAFPPGQDRGQLTRVIAGIDELLVQAAEQMPAAIGQTMSAGGSDPWAVYSVRFWFPFV